MCLSDPFLKLHKLLFLFSFFLKKYGFSVREKDWGEIWDWRNMIGSYFWWFSLTIFLLCFSFLGFRGFKMQFFVFGWGFGLGIWYFFCFRSFSCETRKFVAFGWGFCCDFVGVSIVFFLLLLLVWVILSTNCVSLICS